MKNKIALVTGGSSGIGKSIAINLANNGFKVCINFSNSEERAEKVKQQIERNGGSAVLFKADVSDEKQVIDMFRFIEKEHGVLDVLVNNAGIYIPGFIESSDIEDWDKTMNVNLKGKLLCTKYAVELLKKSSMPRIINIATRGATTIWDECSAYCCAAVGIVTLTKITALELARYGIKVNAISPGLTKTPMTESVDGESEFEDYAKKNPSGRVGKPQDIANIVNFLISKEAEFIVGENINVSGGILLT